MKTLKLLAAAVLASSSLAIAPASAEPGKGPADTLVEVCKLYVDAGVIWETVGECMGENRADDGIYICKILKTDGTLEVFGFKNFGDCVSFFRQL